MLNQSSLLYKFPTFNKVQQETDLTKLKRITVIHPDAISTVQDITPENIKEFLNKHKVTLGGEDKKTTYINIFHTDKEKLDTKTKFLIEYSSELKSHAELAGALSTIFASSYEFSFKTLDTPKEQPEVFYHEDPIVEQAIELAHSKSYARQLGNQRANIATPQYMEEQCRQIAKQCGLQIIVIKDQQLEAQNLPLFKAVGRASVNKPRLVNLSYKGNPQSTEWIAIVGKGLCYDSGGLNIKTGTSMHDMFLDKHGSCSVISSIRSIAKLKLKANVTVSVGFAQNSISGDAYRPSDIFVARNGLTVEIGNTDAEGRLTLADVMTWTQDKYNPTVLVQLSTLTGAVITALGNSAAGIWTNDEQITKDLLLAGNTSRDKVWHMPIFEQHRENVKGKIADLTNHSGKPAGGSSQAAAFLQNFVKKGVKWAHVDIAGASMASSAGNGYGSRLLVKYVQSKSK